MSATSVTDLSWHPSTLLAVSGQHVKVWCSIDATNEWQSQWSAIDLWFASRSDPEARILRSESDVNSARTSDLFWYFCFQGFHLSLRLLLATSFG